MKKNFNNLELIISFTKYLISFYFFIISHGYRPFANQFSPKLRTGQTALEYSLLLVVIAGLMLVFFANNFQPLKDIFNSTTNSMMNRIVNGTY